MKYKRILLVEESYEDILQIQNSIKNLQSEHSLHVVHNIRDALQVLMGGSSQGRLENYSQTGKVRPDIVLLNINFLEQNAHEFLDVINKYYSLKSIRVFVIGDSVQSVDPELAARYGIAGYLVKPFDFQNTMSESVISFRQELTGPGKALSALPGFLLPEKIVRYFQLLKTNAVSFFATQTVVAKVTASSLIAVCVAGAVVVSPVNDKLKSDKYPPISESLAAGNVEITPPATEELVQPVPPVVTETPPAKKETPNQQNAGEPDEPIKEMVISEPRDAAEEPRVYKIMAVEEPEDQQLAGQ